ncbi:unnamed protein product [Rotaria sp. Silwood1]|nr:unnamed protein product [Rotaria sp. Silwood1]CAF3597073.1 unnamed protein product [Rotaria sp. Silwood1]CAF4633136.1 unnamed protein product [Rotaria sp. Silwood1]
MGCSIYNPILKRYYSFFYYPVITSIFPLTITLTTSLLAYHNVRRIIRRQLPVYRRRLDRQMTAMTLARVMVLIIGGVPYVCISLYQLNVNNSENNSTELAIVSFLLSITTSFMHANFVVNFYVFLMVSSRFRRQAKTVLIKKPWRLIKSLYDRTLTSPQRNQVFPEIAQRSFSANELE